MYVWCANRQFKTFFTLKYYRVILSVQIALALISYCDTFNYLNLNQDVKFRTIGHG